MRFIKIVYLDTTKFKLVISSSVFPLPAIVVFYSVLSSMRCSDEESAAGLKCVYVHIHPSLDSSRSGFISV